MPEGDRVESILADWFDQREQGEAPDPAAVIRAHPELADALQRRFAALNLVDLALAPATESQPDVPEHLGPFRIEEMIGRGGMGTVYRATTETKTRLFAVGQSVALKLIHPHLLQTPGFFKRFLREAEIGRNVDHPNVVKTHDVDAIAAGGRSHHYLVMEYVEGQTLHDLLLELERVPEELCRHIGLETAKGLRAIHGAGVVHRDLKPENVIITEDHAVKVMDLGVARLAEEAIRLSQTGHFVGSVEYASPEQFTSSGNTIDERSDLFSLGVVLYELATGRHPFRADDAKVVLQKILQEEPRKAGEVNPQLSPFFEEVVQSLIAKDPDARIGSASTLLTILEEGERGEWWQERARALRAETKRPLRRIRIPRETSVYGREDDLAWMQAAYEKAKVGDGQVLLIEGEAGIGKTRLVDEFVGRMRAIGEDLNFLFGSYPPGGAATASGAFSAAYREQLGAEGLEDSLQHYLQVTPLLVPAFAALLKGDAPPRDAKPLTKDSLQTVFVHATRGLAAERPTIVLIDDLHFAPEDGRALFASVAAASPGHRILLLGTYRPGVPDAWKADLQRLDHASPLTLKRLGPKDLVALLKDAFRSERLAGELGIRIAEKSDGNPFFALEIIRGLKEGQFLTQRPDGTWVTTEIIRDIQIPSTVRDLILARIADLDDEERNLLQVASCLGYEFDPELVGEVLGLRLILTLQSLGRIEMRHRLVRSVGSRYVFDHHQVEEALYEGLNDRLRQAYHAAIADALEPRLSVAEPGTADENGSLRVELCEHHLLGGQGERAVPHLRSALQHLEHGCQSERGSRLARRFLDVPGLLSGELRVDVLLDATRHLAPLGRLRDYEAAALEARDLARELGLVARAAGIGRVLGGVYYKMGRLEEVQALLQASVEIARKTGDRLEEQKSLGNLGIVLASRGEIEAAKRAYDESLQLARELEHPASVAYLTEYLGNLAETMGDFARAGELLEQTLDAWRSLGDLEGETYTATNLGVLRYHEGRPHAAIEILERALELALRIGHRTRECKIRQLLGVIRRDVGDARGAERDAEVALDLAREAGERVMEAESLVALGNLAFDRGDLASAWMCLHDGARMARETGVPWSAGTALANLGTTEMHLGQFAVAQEHLEEGLRLMRGSGPPTEWSITLQQLGELYVDLERTEDAMRCLEEALAIAREGGHRDREGWALVGLARAARRSGRPEEAARRIEEALGVLGDAQVLLRLTIHVERALLGREGVGAALSILSEEPGSASSPVRLPVHYYLWEVTGDGSHLREAKRILDHLVEHAPEEYRESMLKNVRLHREIESAWKALHSERAEGES